MVPGLLLLLPPCLPQPNVVLLLADDLGYGDLSLSGHPTSRTPHIDALFSTSLQLPSFYSSSPVCSPSRASLLTGLPPVSTGVWPGVFTPGDLGGLPPLPTLASLLGSRGYSSLHLGKWHLGTGDSLPTRRGFHRYLGVPYSHDMCPCRECFPGHGACHGTCRPDTVSCPLYRDEAVVQQPVELSGLTDLYTREATSYIRSATEADQPFLLYLAYHHPHHPQFAGPAHANTSARGVFGDSLGELDTSVGVIISTLDTLGIRDNTIVVFTSDNGPSLARHEEGGCAGLLRCGKGTTWEGGVRVPAAISYPSLISPGRLTNPASFLSILPTILALVDAGSDTPISSILSSTLQAEECILFYPEAPQPAVGPYAIR